MVQFWPCHWNLLWVLCSFFFTSTDAENNHSLFSGFCLHIEQKSLTAEEGSVYIKVLLKQPAGLWRASASKEYTEEYPNPSLNGRKSPQTWYFWVWDEHSHLCCLPMREHEKEPRRNGCRGRWRAEMTALLHTWPEAAAGRTQTPAGLRDPSTIATTGSWRTGCGNLRGRNKSN